MSFIEQLVDYLIDTIDSMSDFTYYLYITILMTLESTVFPVPSEVVVAPAAYFSAEGQKNVFLVIFFATLGADMGASINYVVSYYLGRPFVYRFANSKLGKLCLLNQEKVEKSEQFFNKHGVTATLTGRLVPGIRHLISIPAGLVRMNYWKFLMYTTIGACTWNCILAALGWYLNSIVAKDELKATVSEYSHYIVIGIVGIIVLVLAYYIVKSHIKQKNSKKDA